MHTSETWHELIALTRSMADAFQDPTDRVAMLDVVADYERSIGEASSSLAASRVSGMASTRMW